MTMYNQLYEAYRKCFSNEFSKAKIQTDVNQLWKSFKQDKESFPGNVERKVIELQQEKTKKDANLLSYFTRLSTTTVHSSNSPSISDSRHNVVSSEKKSELPMVSSSSDSPSHALHASMLGDDSTLTVQNKGEVKIVSNNEDTDVDNTVTSTSKTRHYATPAQDALKAQISFLEKQLIAAIEGRDSGLAGPNIQKEIKRIRQDLEKCKKILASKESKAKRQQKYRDERRQTLQVLKIENPDLAKCLHIRDAPGRPILEEDQPELLNTIINIAMFGGAADPRRRSELIRSCKTLADLHIELQARGFKISKSGTYLRLLPRDSCTAEGKRHVNTVPVKLCRAQNDARKKHPDGKFCTASIRSVEELISILGPKQVAVISQDDKSRVPMGLTAANKQAPILMHLEYKVRLPDHDWIVAPKHKLIPSVYAGIKIDSKKIGDLRAVTYSGPTYIAIRSAKHCSSTAASHAFDFKSLINLESFRDIIYDKHGQHVKPVVVIMSDGGPDENPRYQKVISYAIDHFKSYNLDALFIITNAPGRSAYNRVERRMAPLSRELAGLILPHDHYGSHLNESAVTINKDLELKNFQFAAETLAEVWSSMVIDGYPVTAEYVKPDCIAQEPDTVSPEWYHLHVKESQYFLQIVKCADKECCGDCRSNLKDVLLTSNGFLPPPFPLRRTSDGLLEIPSPENTHEENSFPDLCLRQSIGLKPGIVTDLPVPYDFYCPTVRDQIEGRTCDICGAYFASKKQKKLHHSIHGRTNSYHKQRAKKIITKREEEVLCELDTLEPIVEWLDEEDVIVLEKEPQGKKDPLALDEKDVFPIIDDLQDWLVPPFESECL